jgi:Flp pilus assembly pilin Flp
MGRTPVEAMTHFLRDDRGQGLVEYALIIGLIAIVAFAALKFLGGRATNSLNNSANQIPS